MGSELKPCPFCGGEAIHIEKDYNHVECHDCCCKTGTYGYRRHAISAWNQRAVDGETSDGYHTFNELYHHRAVLFSKVVEFAGERAWKSKLHADGTMFDGYFIVGVETPEGQATYHYAIGQYWEMFDCKEVEHAPVWDGHTPQEAIARIEHWNQRATPIPDTPEMVRALDDAYEAGRKSAERTCKFVDVNEVETVSDAWCEKQCSCGEWIDVTRKVRPNYCPNCGAKVVE